MRVGQWLCSSVIGLSSRAFRDGDAFMVSLEQVEPSETRYVQKIASIELVCVFQRPYRSERAHDSGDMGARTPQQDEVFFECDPLKVFAWFPVASPACAVDRSVLTMRTIR